MRDTTSTGERGGKSATASNSDALSKRIEEAADDLVDHWFERVDAGV